MVSEQIKSALEQAGSSAASTLGGLLGRGVHIAAQGASSGSASDVASHFSGGVVHVSVAVNGDAEGNGLLAFEEKSAGVMAELMIGGDGSSAPDSLSELHLSALAEVGNQFSAAFVEGLGQASGKSLLGLPSDLTPGQAGDLELVAGALGGDLIIGEFSLSIEGGAPSPLLFVIDGGLAQALGASGGGSAAPASFNPSNAFGGGSMSTPVVQSAQMSQLTGVAGAQGAGNMELLMDVPLQVTVELGRTSKLVKEVLALGPGSVLELDKLAGEPVDILVNEKPIAKGEVVVIDENFGIRVTEILSPKDRISF